MKVDEGMHDVGIIVDYNFKECKAHYNISKRYEQTKIKRKKNIDILVYNKKVSLKSLFL